MPSFKCSDLGMKCSFEIKDENKDEMMQMIAIHGEKTHGIKEITPDFKQKIEKVIKK